MSDSASKVNIRRWHEAGGGDYVPPADARIVTSDGQSIPAHSGVLATASPVLESLLAQSRRSPSAERIIHILGVSHDAVLAFVELLYSKNLAPVREVDVEVAEHGLALLVLAHAYRVPWLKQRCEAVLARRVSAANAVDVLKLAKQCDVPRLHQRCLKLVAADFAAVQESEGWRFVQKHDPNLELEVLRYIEEHQQRKRRWKRERREEELYVQLSEAMDCLQWICAEGPAVRTAAAVAAAAEEEGLLHTRTRSCQNLQGLLHHFTTCGKKLEPKGCTHCNRMSQLFRLHSSICNQDRTCKVPFCTRFKLKMQKEEKVDRTWALLVKKVQAARVMCALAGRKRPEEVQIVQNSLSKHHSRGRSKRYRQI